MERFLLPRAHRFARGGLNAAPVAPAKLAEVFPAPEDRGGWKSLLPESGIPDAPAKAAIRQQAGVDWDKLSRAWDYVAEAPGNTGFLVIRHGVIVGEWYRGGDRKTDFNIYSSSKAYTSTAFGMILSDFGGGASPAGRILMLDTKVCNSDWLPESLPLPDPRKADATVRNFLNMASGLGTEPVPMTRSCGTPTRGDYASRHVRAPAEDDHFMPFRRERTGEDGSNLAGSTGDDDFHW